MAYFQKFTVAFDDGTAVEIQGSSRDMLALEKDGVDLTELKPIEGSYVLAWYALKRLKRLDKIDFDIPDSAEALADVADLDVVDEDAEGKGSDPVPATG